MIQFPETAESEWRITADAAAVSDNLRAQLAHDTQVENEKKRLRIRHDAQLALQQDLAADSTPELVMGSIADFIQRGQTTPVDLIDGVMKIDSTTGVLGPSESGKTTLALQMVHSLLTGTLWLGQPVKQITGKVGILSFDQNAGLMIDWIQATGLDINRVEMLDAHGRGNPLQVPAHRARLAAAWKAAGVEIVLVDSFSASFAGHDQNDTAETMAYYADMKRFVLTEVGAKSTIMILHATDAQPYKPRGSTAHKDVFDSMISICWTDMNDRLSARKVKMMKYREGIGQVQMTPVILTPPDDVTHLVDLDTGAMTLEGMKLPAGSGGAFTAMPDTYQAPDTSDLFDDEEGEEL